MSYGMESSFSGVGHLRDEMHRILIEKASAFEVSMLKDTVARMHNEIEAIRNRLEALEQKELTHD